MMKLVLLRMGIAVFVIICVIFATVSIIYLIQRIPVRVVNCDGCDIVAHAYVQQGQVHLDLTHRNRLGGGSQHLGEYDPSLTVDVTCAADQTVTVKYGKFQRTQDFR